MIRSSACPCWQVDRHRSGPARDHDGRPADTPLQGTRSKSIDVRDWHRQELLPAGQRFSLSWTRAGEPSGGISVRTEANAVVLTFRSKDVGASEWKSIEQRVPITWTECNLGGHRPWFCSSVSSGGQRCGRRVAVLYGVGELFACRQCYRLTYTCQRENRRDRSLTTAQKIRLRLGGSPNMLEPFPDKPKGMHWRTYSRLRTRAEKAASLSNALTLSWLSRQKIQIR
jgi:hypothetical protein